MYLYVQQHSLSHMVTLGKKNQLKTYLNILCTIKTCSGIAQVAAFVKNHCFPAELVLHGYYV